ncbi:type IV secretory system conjugative DNA transfer family protein [Microlunatus flavus]|uniref:type IV secretory system conjugative DNA transfer family protein n=1 Tax=Microlunatus flavus TaxID=1036181 RepID=UPI001E4CA2C3|nr:TraM recognition domain-containing protein [Microlunatus flavus]
MPWDRTTGVLGPQGSGKTLDLLVPALLDAPGAALVSTTKPDDLYLTWNHRRHHRLPHSGGSADLPGPDRPCVVADPFGLAPHLTPLVWDPIAGCADPWIAHRRAQAFCGGLSGADGAGGGGGGSDASRFYAAEAAKVTAGFLHAAALAGHPLDQLLRWVADPTAAVEPVHILRRHPGAAPQWHGLLHAALHGDDRTAANTATTVQQALGLFFQPALRARCTPTPQTPATDLADVLQRRGTVYLLGRDDPYAPATPLMTAIAEDVLDTALHLAHTSPYGRLCPPLLACLDELPSIAPLPTLQTRMANDRALGISFVWAAQTWTQLVARFGTTGAQTLLGLTNVLVVFGGTTDATLTQHLTRLSGRTRTPRVSWTTGSLGTARSRNISGEDLATLTDDEIRLLPPGHALVLADQAPPLIAQLRRATRGARGQQLLRDQGWLRRNGGSDS